MLQLQPRVQHNVRRMQRRHERPQRVVHSPVPSRWIGSLFGRLKYGSIPSRWIGSLFGRLNAPCLNAPPLVAVARQPVPVQGASVGPHINIREADVARGRQLKVPTRRREIGQKSLCSKRREGGTNEGATNEGATRSNKPRQTGSQRRVHRQRQRGSIRSGQKEPRLWWCG